MSLKFLNPCNGFLRVESEKSVFICDPWLSDGIYDGGWRTFPPVRNPQNAILGATHVYISHIHEDHFDLKVIDQLARDIFILLPKVYPFHVMQSKLLALGFKNIQILSPGEKYKFTDFSLEVIPPMNAFGQTSEAYDLENQQDQAAIAIDTGIVYTSDVGLKAILLADNFPYDLKAKGVNLDNYFECDLLAFPYNGLASDFPTCYFDFSIAEAQTIVAHVEEKRHKTLDNFINLIKPKLLLPYSSDFAVVGPQAKRFAEIAVGWWASKETVAKRYSAVHDIPAVYLYEGDVLTLSLTGYSCFKSSNLRPSLVEFANESFTEKTTSELLYSHLSQNLTDMEKMVDQSADHMFLFIDKLGIKTDWVIGIKVFDKTDWPQFYIDLKNRHVSHDIASNQKLLVCEIYSGYLVAIFTNKAHWNNAKLSFQLRWSRLPNIYDEALYKAMNFFHLPKNQNH